MIAEHRSLEDEETCSGPLTHPLPPAATHDPCTPAVLEGSATPDEDVPLADAYAEAMHLFRLAAPHHGSPSHLSLPASDTPHRQAPAQADLPSSAPTISVTPALSHDAPALPHPPFQ